MGFNEILEKGKVVCFTTASKEGKPNSIYAEAWLFEGKILIVDCHMEKTFKNLQENNQVTVAVENGKEWYQIKGNAEYSTSGKYFEKAKEIVKGTEYTAKGAVAISIQEVWDLDNRKRII